jgi:hypothetical protein
VRKSGCADAVLAMRHAQLAVYINDPVLLYQFQKWAMCYVYGEQSSF